MSQVTISKKDKHFREFALTGDLWKVVLYVGFPLAFYQSLSLIFRLADTMMASHISAQSVSAVAYLNQINSMISAIGGGLAVGGSLEISKAYGAGDYPMVKKRVSSLLAICAMFGAVILCIIPFCDKILILANTPKDLIDIGKDYFSIELIAIVITFFNNVYLAIERARGNTKRILYLNMLIIVIKLSLTAIFVYVLHSGILMIGIANIIAQAVLLCAAFLNLNKKENAFGFSVKSVRFQRKVIMPMLKLSGPVIVEKMAFSMGKVIVNSMSSGYGSLAIGALSISNNISSITTGPPNGFQEGTAAIISQNLGDQRVKRALDAFKRTLVINLAIGITGFVVIWLFISPITYIFASSSIGFDSEFQKMIISMYRLESIGSCIPLAINSAITSLFLGFGYTKLTLLINFLRVFLFRIPVLYVLQHYTKLGAESCGMVMLISNGTTVVFSSVLAVFVIRNICKKNNINFLR